MNGDLLIPILIVLGIGISLLLLTLIVLVLRLSSSSRTGPFEKTWTALQQLKTELSMVSASLNKANQDDAFYRGQLSTQLVTITQISHKLTEETASMNAALRGNNRTQGIWGELVLEKVLELSGLKENRDYKKQATISTDDGSKLRPDIIVLLPKQRFVIIDAKVSLSAYTRHVSLVQQGEDGEKASKEHTQSIRSHIVSLGKKQYSKIHGAQSLDLTLMFLPGEHILSHALDQDSTLLSFALDNKVIPVTPTTLMLALQLIHQLWQQQEQDTIARQIIGKTRILTNKTIEIWDQIQVLQERIESTGVQAQKINRLFTSPRSGLLTLTGNLEELDRTPAEFSPEQD